MKKLQSREAQKLSSAPEADVALRLSRQVALVSEVGSEIAGLHDADQILQVAVRRVQQDMDYRRMAAMMLEASQLVHKTQSPMSLPGQPEPGLPSPTWQSRAAEHVVATGEPFSFFADEVHSTGVIVPLRVQNSVLGVLIVEFGAEDQAEETELPFLLAMASLVAMAVQNIHLFQTAVDRNQHLEQRADRVSQMLGASSHLLRLSPRSESLLLAVARLAHEWLGFGLVAASQLEPDGERLLTQMLVVRRPETLPQVRLVRGEWARLNRLLRSEFRVSRSYRLSWADVEENYGEDEVSFHLPEVVPGEGPWRPQRALLVPLHGRVGRITGVLTLDYPEGDLPPSLATVQSAEILANQAAIALDNARLFEELQRRLRETNTLFAMGQELLTTLDQQEVLVSIARAALALVSAAGKVVIHLLDKTGNLIPRVVRPPLPRAFASTGMRIGEGIAGLAAAQNRALYVSDVSQDARFVGRLTNYLSLLVAPISVGERVIGTLSVDSSQVDAFRPDDERVLIILANQAAIALENARLYASAKRVDEMAMLNHLNSRLASSLERMEILHIGVEEIARALKAEASAIVLLQEEDKPSAPIIVFCCRSDEGEQGEDPFRLESRELSPRFSEGELLAELATVGVVVRQSLHAILAARGRVLGYVEVYNLADENSSDKALTLLNSMATAVAMALENARLYEDVRDSAKELAASQAQLIQSTKLAATGKLAASIAHEINNPLQAVQSCVYLLSDSISEEDPNRPYLNIAREELGRIARIVEQMVDFYRPAKEGRVPTDLNHLLEGVLSLVRQRMQQAEVALQTDLDPNLPKVPVIADHIKQVFLNLVLNALEAMPDGGELKVATRLVVTSEWPSVSLQEAQQVEVRFVDSGTGIKPQDLPRIFDPFFTSKSRGTGLGLSISYGIVERHGGTIEVESVLGQGATFTVLLPVHAGAEETLGVEL